MASRKFHSNIDKENDDIMCVEGAVVTDLLRVQKAADRQFELELPTKNNN